MTLKEIFDASETLIAYEFKDLTPIECLLKIFRENKKYIEEKEKDENH